MCPRPSTRENDPSDLHTRATVKIFLREPEQLLTLYVSFKLAEVQLLWSVHRAAEGTRMSVGHGSTCSAHRIVWGA